MYRLSCFLLAALFTAAPAGAQSPSGEQDPTGAQSPTSAQSSTPVGVWLHDNRRIEVEIAPCGEYLCGRLVWLKSPKDPQGLPRVDSKNPDAALRTRPLLGLTVLDGLRPTAEGTWEDGNIYNPDDGEDYSASVSIREDGAMQVRAYEHLPAFGKTLIWTRMR